MAESKNVMLMVALSWITFTTAQQMTNHKANPPCEAPLVWEGQTGKLKFFYRPEASSSDDFFAILKRADNPGKDIIVCTTQLGIKCNVSSPQYNLHSVTNHSLTVLIPRITKDFEDTYMLLTYTNRTVLPTDTCHLVVKANKETCDNPAVLEGQIGKLTFFLRPDVLAFEDFFATVRRADTPGRDILVCTRKSPINCHISSPHLYQSNGIVDATLTLLIPNVSRAFEDTYVLKVYANGSSQPFDACSLHVKGLPNKASSDIPSTVVPPVVGVPVVVVVVVVVVAVLITVILVLKRKNKSDERDGSSPLLPHNHPADVADKRWYFGLMPAEVESKLPRFERNGPGSFLIREERGKYLILAVCGKNRENKRFRINTEAGYTIEGSNNTFETLTELVNNYRTNDMILDGISFGKLGTSFELKPKGEWYAGELTREEEQTLFESKGQERGSFLIRNNITFPGLYSLAVNIGGDTKHFRISVDENCFKLSDANKTFKSLAELVNHYQTNDIVTHEGNFGRLGSPIRAGGGGEKCCCLFNNII